ncbi:pyrroline-5-carboxylate reductase [Chlorobium phaeovibrioides]|uniref:Pyrroline-5-carboxylate reductase n=2 Tax=Chlorobium phaeovibrioides TaxID=1094 RepID=A0A432AST4_CHLPH|nr:pyrroline-5-carboxylate reductase [Chlorobium phaeovibrioides]HCD36541.1 pyrroline-5-carboxylate reductase [Chlorobium sp.]KAA6231868.1 pyrroline-5-carboxylate reductase [Chlorobium phaeovibrioides]MWV53485.1 pyrroline-5-carboxylate reductase [Chlorobium phaeovibrioides]QEQ57575.1 pyrroline-5-carboxylate reductase [Chlorobium phaeovibrioides]RTY36209.1 pyrroline-5-carboxylate reductase [Chlorobium phaeovibrioides]
MSTLHIGFIGTGRIASAIIAGLSSRKETTLLGFDRDPEALRPLASAYGLTPCTSPAELAKGSTVIILAVKPYQIQEVLDELRPSLSPSHLLVSVAAGISTEFIRENTSDETRVIRVMPNTPAFFGEGMSALCRGKNATTRDSDIVSSLLGAIGRVALLEESQMDAATALSGSGPAYMFHILASLAEGGVQCGLTREQALLLGAQTMLGAARMVLNGDKSPEELIRQVTTPGGTTEAGLKVMDERNIRATLVDAVAAAATRSRELGQ